MRFGLGWSASGILVTALRSAIGAEPEPLDDAVAPGSPMVTQTSPSLPRLMLSG